MALSTGPISLAYGTSPSEAFNHKFATGPSEIFDETLGASTAYFVNGVDKPPQAGVTLKAPFRFSPDVAGGRLGYHVKGGESLYLIQRVRAAFTFDIAGGANSVVFIQMAIYDAVTGAYKDTRTLEYADFYTTAPAGFSTDPVMPVSRDGVLGNIGGPLAAGDVAVIFGIIRIVPASD